MLSEQTQSDLLTLADHIEHLPPGEYSIKGSPFTDSDQMCVDGHMKTLLGAERTREISGEMKTLQISWWDFIMPPAYDRHPELYPASRAARMLRTLANTGRLDWGTEP